MTNRCRGCALNWPLYDQQQVPKDTVQLVCENCHQIHVPMTKARRNLSGEELDAMDVISAVTGDLGAVEDFVEKRAKKG